MVLTGEFVEFESVCDGEEEELVGDCYYGRYAQVVVVENVCDSHGEGAW